MPDNTSESSSVERDSFALYLGRAHSEIMKWPRWKREFAGACYGTGETQYLTEDERIWLHMKRECTKISK